MKGALIIEKKFAAEISTLSFNTDQTASVTIGLSIVSEDNGQTTLTQVAQQSYYLMAEDAKKIADLVTLDGETLGEAQRRSVLALLREKGLVAF